MRSETSNLEATKSIAHRLVDEVFEKGDIRVFDELVADEYVNHTMPVPSIPGNKEGFRQLVLATRQAFPDVRVHIGHAVAEDDFVVFHDVAEATSKGDFMGIPPTNKRMQWTEIHFLRVADNRIVEHWMNFDQLGILKQLGAIPG